MWQEKEKLQREVANLELQLKMKKKIAELDQHIHLQVRFYTIINIIMKLSCVIFAILVQYCRCRD